MAVLDSLRIELCSVVVHEDIYAYEGARQKWDDLVGRCVVGYRIYFNEKTIGAGVGNAFPAVVSMVDFISSGCELAEIRFADDITFSLSREIQSGKFIFSVSEYGLQFYCNKSQLIAFIFSMSGEIMCGAKQFGFEIGPHLGLHVTCT
jgi:hypothetical protein